MTFDPYRSRHKTQRATIDADQAEVAAIRRGIVSTETGATDDRIAGTLYLNDDGRDRERWHKQDIADEAVVGRTAEELERRARAMGEAYPFELDGARLSYRPSKHGLYEFFLAISVAHTITEGLYVNLPRDFERVVALIFKLHLGPHSDVLHTGAPRDAAIGSTFTEAMRKLHEATQEWVWNPEDHLPRIHTSTGDEGVDFVAWKHTLDGRPGRIFFLGQCACGNDWTTKYNDISWGRFKKWFRPEVVPTPMKVFATPFHVTDATLREAQRDAGLVLDRMRLVLMAAHVEPDSAIAAWAPRLAERRALVIPDAAA